MTPPDTMHAPPPYSCTRVRTLKSGGRDVFDASVSASPDEDVATAFLRTPFNPVDVLAVNRDTRQANALRGDDVSGDWRWPGSESLLHVSVDVSVDAAGVMSLLATWAWTANQ